MNGVRRFFATFLAAAAANSCGDDPITTSGRGSDFRSRHTEREKLSQFKARRQSFRSYGAAQIQRISTPSSVSVTGARLFGSDRRLNVRRCKWKSEATIVTRQPRRTSSRPSSKWRVPPPSTGSIAN
jgi:hypothetical protein